MRVLVPFDAQSPKTRLSPVLDAEERVAFARAMCRDVVAAIQAAGHDPTVLATAPIDLGAAPVDVDDRPLTPAVNAALAEADLPVAIAMADLPLVTPAALDRLVGDPAEVVVAPGLGGGTNALVVRTDAFSVDFHGVSIRDHREAATTAGVDVSVVDSFRLALDVDEPDDLAEVLLHAEGRAREWLDSAGLSVAVREGRVTVTRTVEGGG